jgi:hypothetical protein
MEQVAMNTFETSATVQDDGQVHLAGIPFAPGTEVTISIREKSESDSAAQERELKEAGARARELFAKLQGRNSEPIGPLRREELYDRKVLR